MGTWLLFHLSFACFLSLLQTESLTLPAVDLQLWSVSCGLCSSSCLVPEPYSKLPWLSVRYFPPNHLIYPPLTLTRVPLPYQFLILSAWLMVKLHMSFAHACPTTCRTQPPLSACSSAPGITQCQAFCSLGKAGRCRLTNDSDRHTGCHS